MRIVLYVRSSQIENVYALAVAAYRSSIVFSTTEVDSDGMQNAVIFTCDDEITDVDTRLIQACFSAGWVYGYYVEVMPCSQV